MRLPVRLSVPHAGLCVPPEAQPYCRLTPEQIAADGDEGAGEIYDLRGHVAEFVTTDVARAIVDLNRAEDDRRPDGVVKTETCWNVPVYSEYPSEEIIAVLLEKYYRPYHEKLSAAPQGARIGIDCHTMAATGPPVGPDPGKERPYICLSNAEGTCPQHWMETFRDCFSSLFKGPVLINTPFKGGFITRAHAREMPWMQLVSSLLRL